MACQTSIFGAVGLQAERGKRKLELQPEIIAQQSINLEIKSWVFPCSLSLQLLTRQICHLCGIAAALSNHKICIFLSELPSAFRKDHHTLD